MVIKIYMAIKSSGALAATEFSGMRGGNEGVGGGIIPWPI